MLLPGVTGADHSWRKAEGQERRECARHRRLAASSDEWRDELSFPTRFVSKREINHFEICWTIKVGKSDCVFWWLLYYLNQIIRNWSREKLDGDYCGKSGGKNGGFDHIFDMQRLWWGMMWGYLLRVVPVEKCTRGLTNFHDMGRTSLVSTFGACFGLLITFTYEIRSNRTFESET
jgi:hypothetical protein